MVGSKFGQQFPPLVKVELFGYCSSAFKGVCSPAGCLVASAGSLSKGGNLPAKALGLVEGLAVGVPVGGGLGLGLGLELGLDVSIPVRG